MSDSDISKTIDNAQSVTEDLDNLRKEKEKDILEDNKSGMQTEHDILTGVIEHIQDNKEEVILDIKIDDNGEYLTKEFSLQKPSSPSEYNINNELLRFIHIFGTNKENPSDINSVVERKINIKKKENEYSLHFPDELSKYNMLKYRCKNRLISKGIINWDTSIKSIFNNYHSPVYITGIIFITLSILSLNNILNNILIESFLVSGISAVAGFAFFQALIIDIIENTDGELLSKLNVIFYLLLFSLMPLGLLNIIPEVSLSGESVIISISSILQILSISLSLIISVVILIILCVLILKDINNIYNKLLNKYRLRKGIEFIK